MGRDANKQQEKINKKTTAKSTWQLVLLEYRIKLKYRKTDSATSVLKVEWNILMGKICSAIHWMKYGGNMILVEEIVYLRERYLNKRNIYYLLI